MPRSDDWTIHMPHPVIKRWARVTRRRITCRQYLPPRLPSLCLASLIPMGETLGAFMTFYLGDGIGARFFLERVARAAACDFAASPPATSG